MGVGAPRPAGAGARTRRTLRIAAMYMDGTAAAYYRAMLPLRELERRGHHVLWPARNDYDRLLADASGFDVLLMHHFCREQDVELVRRLAREGVAVVWVGRERPRRPGVAIGIVAAGEHAVDFEKLRFDRTLRLLDRTRACAW